MHPYRELPPTHLYLVSYKRSLSFAAPYNVMRCERLVWARDDPDALTQVIADGAEDVSCVTVRKMR